MQAVLLRCKKRYGAVCITEIKKIEIAIGLLNYTGNRVINIILWNVLIIELG